MDRTDQNKGFTLIEILVVLAITALLSGIAIVYSHQGQNQVSLSIEESKVAQLILEARELSIATYSMNSATCAYGVHFDFSKQPYTYSLFAYNSAVKTGSRFICPSLASSTVVTTGDMVQYLGGSSWQVHTASGVVLKSSGSAGPTIQDILFYPPDPFTLISTDGKTFQYPAPTAYVYLSTTDGTAARTITVNPEGQVSL